LFCGVDSHKDTLAACLVDQTGRRPAAAVFPNTPAGHHELATWLDRHGPVGRVGVEGGANLGAGLARFLADQGVDVREVPCALTVRERRRLRRPGKSDPTDALAIARLHVLERHQRFQEYLYLAEAEGQTAAGIFSTGESVTAILNTHGLYCYHAETDADCAIDVVANRARERRVRCAVSTSLGFGGNDSAIVVREFET